MGKIKILPENIANKIAAGEVVERPSSVVKELVENSIDSKASKIKIEVESGGVEKIRVTDDGEGMDKEDLQLCFKRHGTSKISSEEDLLGIKSMGFRGEAIASIAAVSKVNIKSKTEQDDIGNMIEVEGGEIKNISSVGMPIGTSVSVEDLFYNVPARKKFLKSTSTEFRHISDMVTNNALAYPQLGFSLSHNKKEILDLPKNQALEERIKSLLGETLFDNLLPIFFDHPHLKVSGFVSKPQFASDRSYKQYTFVNQRRVKDRVVAGSVRKAFGTLLPAKTYPIFVIFLKLPCEMVDVNVHPRKEEVKFVSSNFIFEAVKNSVSKALGKNDLTFSPTAQNRVQLCGRTVAKGRLGKGLTYGIERVIKETLPWEVEELKTLDRPLEILQAHNLYLIAPSSEGIIIVDQHAAHERILYEKFLEDFKKEKDSLNTQQLLIAETFDLPAAESEILEENLNIFEKLGFEIEEFGKNSYKITSVPSEIKDRSPVNIITNVISDLIEDGKPREIDEKQKRIISLLACRSALKSGDLLSNEERRALLEKLDQTKTKYTCPHGRPVKIEISLKELHKMFKRS